MLSRFHLIPERYVQTDGPTDGRTDRFAISISRVSAQRRAIKKSLIECNTSVTNYLLNWRRLFFLLQHVEEPTRQDNG